MRRKHQPLGGPFWNPSTRRTPSFSHPPSWSPVCWVSWVSSTSSSSPFRCGVRRNPSECVGMRRNVSKVETKGRSLSVFFPFVSIFKRLRATAGQGPNYVGPFCGYAGLCWPMLAYLAGNVGPACGYVGLMLIHVEPKDPKNGNSKKTL